MTFSVSTTLPVTEARKRIFEIVNDIENTSRHYTLTEHGRPKVVMMPSEEFESWMETLDIMSRPDLMKEILTSHDDYRKGKVVSLEKVLNKENEPVSLKPSKTQRHVSGRSQKKRREKSSKD